MGEAAAAAHNVLPVDAAVVNLRRNEAMFNSGRWSLTIAMSGCCGGDWLDFEGRKFDSICLSHLFSHPC